MDGVRLPLASTPCSVCGAPADHAIVFATYSVIFHLSVAHRPCATGQAYDERVRRSRERIKTDGYRVARKR